MLLWLRWLLSSPHIVCHCAIHAGSSGVSFLFDAMNQSPSEEISAATRYEIRLCRIQEVISYGMIEYRIPRINVRINLANVWGHIDISAMGMSNKEGIWLNMSGILPMRAHEKPPEWSQHQTRPEAFRTTQENDTIKHCLLSKYQGDVGTSVRWLTASEGFTSGSS